MDKVMTIHVSEVFYSIQGEGHSMGVPAVFVRLTGCNLDCIWCDTTEVWKKGEKLRFDQVLNEEQLKAIDDGARLIFTGGEPLLQQGKIIQFVRYLISDFQIYPKIEIETNGTIVPNIELDQMVYQYNVSPKTANSGHEAHERLNIDSLIFFKQRTNAFWKFVVGNEEDISEVYRTFIGDFNTKEKIYFMPQAENLDQLNRVAPWLAERCKELRVNFGNRLHIQIWNQKTGV